MLMLVPFMFDENCGCVGWTTGFAESHLLWTKPKFFVLLLVFLALNLDLGASILMVRCFNKSASIQLVSGGTQGSQDWAGRCYWDVGAQNPVEIPQKPTKVCIFTRSMLLLISLGLYTEEQYIMNCMIFAQWIVIVIFFIYFWYNE